MTKGQTPEASASLLIPAENAVEVLVALKAYRTVTEGMGIEPLQVDCNDAVTQVSDRGKISTFLPVMISTIRLGEWHIVAWVDHTELGDPIFKCWPGESLPEKFMADYRPRECDHCQTNRKRDVVLVLKSATTGALTQLGTTCVNAYTGAGQHSRHAIKMVDTLLRDRAPSNAGDALYTTEGVLTMAAASTRAHGFVRSKDEGSTAGHVRRCYYDDSSYQNLDIQPADRELARNVIAWASDHFAADRRGTFGDAVHKILRDNGVTSSNVPYLAPLPMMYQHHLAQAAELCDAPKFDGGRVTMQGEIISFPTGQFGTQMRVKVPSGKTDGKHWVCQGKIPRSLIETSFDDDLVDTLVPGATVRWDARFRSHRDDSTMAWFSHPTKGSVV